MRAGSVGATQELVAGGGFREIRGLRFLAGADGTARFFLELEADPDRPEVRPREAWAALLSALPPGWGIRALWIVWPDPIPRQAFLEGLDRWEDRDGLREELRAFLAMEPPPLRRRGILEIAVPPADLAEAPGLLDGFRALLGSYGVMARPMDEGAVMDLARRILCPSPAGERP